MRFYWTALAVKIPNANERLPGRCRAFEVYRNLPSQAAMLPSYLIRACVALLEARRFFFLFPFLHSCFNNNDSTVKSGGHEIVGVFTRCLSALLLK